MSNLTLTLLVRGDASAAEATLAALVRVSAEAGKQISTSLAAGFAGAQVPAPDLSAFNREIEEGRQRAAATLASLARPITLPAPVLPPPVVPAPVIPPAVLPPPVVLAPPVVPVPVVPPPVLPPPVVPAPVIPPAVLPPPVVLAPPVVPVPVVPPPAPTPPVVLPPPVLPPPSTGGWEKVRAQAEALLKQPFEEVGATLDQVRAAKAALDGQLQSASTTAMRAEVMTLTAGLTDLERQMLTTARAKSAMAGQASTASMAMVSLAQGAQDAASVHADLGMIVRASANNVAQFASLLPYVRQEAAAAGRTIRQALVASLAGPGGFILALTAAQVAADVLGPALEGMFDRAGAAARQAKTDFEEALGGILRFQSGAATFTLTSAAEASDLMYARTAENRQIQTALERLNREREQIFIRNTRSGQAGFVPTLSDEDQERVEEIARSVQQLNVRIGENEIVIERATQGLREFNAAARVVEDLGRDGGGLTPDLTPEQLAAQRRALQERTRAARREQTEARQLAEQAEREREAIVERATALLSDLRIEAIVDERAREIAAVRQTLGERVALARAAYGEQSEAERLAREAAAMAEAGINARHAQAAYEEEARWRQAGAELDERAARLEGQTEEAALAARIARARAERDELDRLLRERAESDAGGAGMLPESEGWEAAVRERYDALVEASAEAYDEIERDATAAELDLAEFRGRRRSQEEEAGQRHADRMASIEERRARLVGASEAEALAMRLAAMMAELAAAETTAERKMELEYEVADLQLRLAEQQRDREQRLYEERLRTIEGHTRSVSNAVQDAARPQARRSEAEIREERRRLREQEDGLNESYRTREINAEEFNDRMTLLAEQRAEFERGVEEERSGFLSRLAGNLTDVLVEEGERLLVRLIAQGIQRLLFGQAMAAASAAGTAATMSAVAAAAAPAATLVSTATFGGAAVAGAAAIATALAAVEALSSTGVPGFTSGGYTGPGGKYEVAGLVHAGEFVLRQEATRGNERELHALQEMLARGLDLAAILPGYAEGGLVGAALALNSPAEQYGRATSGGGAGIDVGPMVAGLGRLERRLERQTEAVTTALARNARDVAGSVASPAKARRLQNLAREREALVNPRGGAL